MSQIFISYGRDGGSGENLAKAIQQQLQVSGYTVFRDVIGLKPGDVWYSKLEFELEACDVMVLVVSEKIRHSKWVHNEVSMAEEIGKPVIPVLAEQIRTPLWLRHLQVLDFCNQQEWKHLLEAIHPHLSVDPIQQKQSLQAQKKQPPKDIISKIVTEADNSPVWASHSGEDQYGRYADLDVKGIIQRCRWIKPGKFWMGSPEDEAERVGNETRHQVTLTQGFWLADTVCTQSLWEAVMGNNPSDFKSKENPVETVSWDDVQTFLQTLNTSVSGLKTDLARLPTEAEWEYACRAGTETPFSFGKTITPQQVNYDGNFPYGKAKEGLYREKTVVVKSLPANYWGLYEMHGNVWEWCQDGYGDYPAEQGVDPKGSEVGEYRVLRGGGWIGRGESARSAYRSIYSPDSRSNSVGFRFALGHASSGQR